MFCAPFSSAHFVVSSRCVFPLCLFVLSFRCRVLSVFLFVCRVVVSFRLISFCCCVSFCRTDVRIVFFLFVVSNCCSVSFLCGVAFRFVELAFVSLCGVVSYCLFVCRVVMAYRFFSLCGVELLFRVVVWCGVVLSFRCDVMFYRTDVRVVFVLFSFSLCRTDVRVMGW